jgi:hypothetical protein
VSTSLPLELIASNTTLHLTNVFKISVVKKHILKFKIMQKASIFTTKNHLKMLSLSRKILILRRRGNLKSRSQINTELTRVAQAAMSMIFKM